MRSSGGAFGSAFCWPESCESGPPGAGEAAGAAGATYSTATDTDWLVPLACDCGQHRFTVDDASTWTRPWTVAFPMVKSEGPIFEYACHEGNYGLMNILSGARWQENAAAEAGRKKK